MKKRIIVSGVGLAVLALGLSINAGAEARDRFAGAAMAQAQTITNLNTQRTQLESRIATGLAQGQLTAQQAADFRAQLNLVAVQQAQSLADNILTLQETQSLISSLNNTDTSIQSAINTYIANQASLNAASNVSLPGSNPWTGSNPWLSSNINTSNPAFAAWHSRQRQEILNLQTQLSSKLETGRVNGRLSAKEYSSLKAEYDRINNSIQRLATSNSRFSRGEMNSVTNRLYNLEDRINKEMRDREFASRYGRRYW